MDGISVFGKLRSTLCDVPVLTHLNTHNFPSYPLSAFSYCASVSDYKLYLITCLQFRAGTHDTTNVGRHRQWRNYNSPPPPSSGKHSLRANSLDTQFGPPCAPFTVLGPWAPRHGRGCRWLVTPYDTIRDAILTCARKPT